MWVQSEEWLLLGFVQVQTRFSFDNYFDQQSPKDCFVIVFRLFIILCIHIWCCDRQIRYNSNLALYLKGFETVFVFMAPSAGVQSINTMTTSPQKPLNETLLFIM